MAKYAVIIVAAGKSSRFKHKFYKKPYAILGGRAVWMHSAEKFLNRNDVAQAILVISPDDRPMFQEKFAGNAAILGVEVVMGGDQRSDSVENALKTVKDDVDFIAIHDVARPCICDEWIDRVFFKAEETGAAMLAVPEANTLKRVDDKGHITETVSREGIWEAQTPQVFDRELLMRAYAKRDKAAVTDDSQLVENIGHPVVVVPGSPINFKITTFEDLKFAEQAIRALPKPKLDRPDHPFAGDDMWR